MTFDVTPAQYSKDEITVGIAHFGVGNFHRAHQAVYLHKLFEQGLARDWGICGIGVMPGDVRMREALASQNFQYTHVERQADGGASARKIASIVDYLYAPDDPEAVLELLSQGSTRIVSLTITEGGYNTSSVTGEFDPHNPAIVDDLAAGALPSTVFGLVVEALRRRRAAGIPPFTIMSCDNLQANGTVARNAFVAFASLKDPELGGWIHDNVAFPSTMVDRITPATSEGDREYVRQRFGVSEPWPVLSEDFIQWVIEDSFTAGRPELETVGVELVNDVEPYEHMKLRLLNASHQVLTYFGLLLGYQFVDEAATDPLIARLLQRYLAEEAEPTIEKMAGFDTAAYGRTVISRFSNRSIRDTLSRIATDASDRIATFLVPVAIDSMRDGRPTPMVAAVIASWAHFAQTESLASSITDRQQTIVDEALAMQGRHRAGFLLDERLMGEVANSSGFVESFVAAHTAIAIDGPRKALQKIVGAA